jgi:hypothetical protein
VKCRPLYEYSYFVQRIREYMDDNRDRDEAIALAMDACVHEGIMVNFINTYGSEVRNMLFTEFNLEDALEVRGEERYEDGLAEGRAKGRAEGRAEGDVRGETRSKVGIIRKKLEKGCTVHDIADWLEFDERYVKNVAALCSAYPTDTDAQIAERLLKLS